MPIGPYPNWAACIADQKRKGHSQVSAEKICGAIERDTKKKPRKLKDVVMGKKK